MTSSTSNELGSAWLLISKPRRALPIHDPKLSRKMLAMIAKAIGVDPYARTNLPIAPRMAFDPHFPAARFGNVKSATQYWDSEMSAVTPLPRGPKNAKGRSEYK